MTQLDARSASGARIGNRLARLPMVFLLTVGLLLSLMHCAGCGLEFASVNKATVTISQDQSSTPDTPEQQLPCHSGHCLSHVVAQPASTIAIPADRPALTRAMRQGPFTVAQAGLPLFKPPRT
jgi:hypothetical protein